MAATTAWNALLHSSALSRSLWGQSRCGVSTFWHHGMSNALLYPRAASVFFTGSKFTYKPDTWAKEFPIAKKGQRQSPINIDTKATTFDEKLIKNPLTISYKPEPSIEATNTGLSFMVTCLQPSELKGGPLTGTYRLEQFHFHWGATDDRGSEHTIDNQTFPAELHLVHWNADKYTTFAAAMDKQDGLAVLGVFLQVGKEHKDFAILANIVDRVKFKDNHSTVAAKFNPTHLLPKNTSRYWTYPGSLTTPPLHESVTWILFEEVVEVSPEQLNALRGLCFEHEGDCIVDNYRCPLPLGNRVLKASFK